MVTSYYAVFSTSNPDKMLDHLTKNMDCTVSHKLEIGDFCYYVVKDALGNSTDYFHSAKYNIPDGFFGVRINVDDFAKAKKHLEAKGYTSLYGDSEQDTCTHAIYMAKEGTHNPNILLFHHKRK